MLEKKYFKMTGEIPPPVQGAASLRSYRPSRDLLVSTEELKESKSSNQSPNRLKSVSNPRRNFIFESSHRSSVMFK